MKLKSFYFILVGLLFFSACESGEKSELDKLKDEVMAVHDEVMPEIKYMQKLVKELKNEPADTPESKKEINTLIYNINEADSLMFDWMRNYRVPKKVEDEAKVKSYLLEELDKISLVNKKMKSSILAAESKLKK